MTEEKKPQPQKAPPKDAQQIVRRLQGEDGYEIFADRHGIDDRDRLRREYEDSRP